MSVIIEDEEGWSVSLTSSNPQREDCIDCRTYEDAERLYNFLEKKSTEEELNEGEIYAGVIINPDGTGHHLILLPGEADSVNWKNAKEFAAKAGGELPTRREQSLLYANLKEGFQERAYWSGEQHAAYAGFAWYQIFSYGIQVSYSKDTTLRARAVRRVAI